MPVRQVPSTGATREAPRTLPGRLEPCPTTPLSGPSWPVRGWRAGRVDADQAREFFRDQFTNAFSPVELLLLIPPAYPVAGGVSRYDLSRGTPRTRDLADS